MKSIMSIPYGILSAILFCACATDAEETVSATASVPGLKSLSLDISNKANQYDYIGTAYRDYLVAYKSADFSPGSYSDIQAIVHDLTNGNQQPSNDTAKQNLLSACMNNPEIAMGIILKQSDLSQNGSMLLSGFINNYGNLSQMPFSEAYGEIIALENSVISSATLPELDQRVILSVASITR